MNSKSHWIIISGLLFLAIMASCSVALADILPPPRMPFDNHRHRRDPSSSLLCKDCFEYYDCDSKKFIKENVVIYDVGNCKYASPKECDYEELCILRAIKEAENAKQFDRIKELAPQLKKCKSCFQYYNCDKKDWNFKLDNTMTEGWGCVGVSSFECNYEKTCAEQMPKKTNVPSELPKTESKDIEPLPAPAAANPAEAVPDSIAANPVDSVPAPAAANPAESVPAPIATDPAPQPKTSCSANNTNGGNPLPHALILAAMLAFFTLLAIAFVHRKPNSQAGNKTDTMV